MENVKDMKQRNEALKRIVKNIKDAVSRSMQVIELNGGKPELIKRDLIKILVCSEDIKNLASDLESDARL